MKIYAVIRIRGWAGAPWIFEEHLEKLRLLKRFNAMIYPATPNIEGRLRRVQSYITWGEINEETLALLFKKRLYTKHGSIINNDYLKLKLNIENFDIFVNKIINGELYLHKLDEYFKLPLRLHPPKGGFKEKVNRPYNQKGEFGYRGDKINELLRRMI
jgi:large subunit ribosomal protein L30